MFRESKEYKLLSQIQQAMELYETSYSILKESKTLITNEYPRTTKKCEYLQEFRRVKDRTDFVKGKIASIPCSVEPFTTISSEIRNTIYLSDDYLNLFVDKYELNHDSENIEIKRHEKPIVPTEEMIDSLCGVGVFKKENKKDDLGIERNIEKLRLFVDKDTLDNFKEEEEKEEREDSKQTESISHTSSDKSKLVDYYRDRIQVLKKHNLSTADMEEKLRRLEAELPKPEVKLTKNQKKKLVSPFRNKMSTCHKAYNSVKDNMSEEDVINIYQQTLDIESDFRDIHMHLNEVDLNELNSLLKRIDKLSLEFPGLLNYDFSETRVLIENCRVKLSK